MLEGRLMVPSLLQKCLHAHQWEEWRALPSTNHESRSRRLQPHQALEAQSWNQRPVQVRKTGPILTLQRLLIRRHLQAEKKLLTAWSLLLAFNNHPRVAF